MEEEHQQPGGHHAYQGQDDDALGADPVVKRTEANGCQAGDNVGGNGEEDDFGGGKTEDGPGQDCAECEHPSQAIAEDSRRDQEHQGVARGARQRLHC